MLHYWFNLKEGHHRSRLVKTLLTKTVYAYFSSLLYFAWGVAEAKCISVTAVRVSVCPSPHSDTTARTRMKLGEWQGMPSTCSLLGGFPIGTRVSLLWQHSAEREMSASACTRSVPAFSLRRYTCVEINKRERHIRPTRCEFRSDRNPNPRTEWYRILEHGRSRGIAWTVTQLKKDSSAIRSICGWSMQRLCRLQKG